MIGRALPPHCRRIRNQRRALWRALAEPGLAEVREDFRKNLVTFYRVHVKYASWGGEGRPPAGISEPTRARVCELAGFSESTYKACRRWWEARGYIAIVRPGSTPDLMPAVLRTDEDHNIRQAYVLCAPRHPRAIPCGKTQPAPPDACPSSLTRPLSISRSEIDILPTRTRLTGETFQTKTNQAPRTGGAPRTPRFRTGPLRTLTDGWWAHLTVPFADWPAADLAHAIDHRPGGRPHINTHAPRNPAGWLRWRLSHWLTPDGTAMPPPSRQRQADTDATRAAQAAARAERDALAATRASDAEQTRWRETAHQMLENRPRAEPLRHTERRCGPAAPAPRQTHPDDARRPAAASTAPPPAPEPPRT